jgi:hypothetical protein
MKNQLAAFLTCPPDIDTGEMLLTCPLEPAPFLGPFSKLVLKFVNLPPF